MYSTIAGIDLDPQRPGYKHIVIRPRIGGGLTWARGSLKSPYGLIESSWKIGGNDVLLSVTIPPNTTATLQLPGVDAKEVGAGRHELRARI
jgi:alpha-L-rhamnosidase